MKILILTHGKFCHGILESYEMIAGKNDNIYAIDLNDDGIGIFSKKVTSKLDELIQDSEVIVLTDVQGGTPFNEAMKYQLLHSDKVQLISGLNLPMLLELGISIEGTDDSRSLALEAIDIGKSGINLSDIDQDFKDDDLEF